ncbi:phosphatidylserine decarboxylase [Sulfuriflexus mobilis]|uniref:phosphatidylserine decarboxylase n=1 Tax=Sulfuriflexus mobilis TaxID=1811807 RepID=UPI000F827DBC|nr:phosphatidylserine decarboxylase [Sulfuriflexus mobilis]
MQKKHTFIAQEGRPYILLSLVLAGLVWFYLGLTASLPIWPVPFILIFLFRDPVRTIPAEPLAIVSPVDGEVIEVEAVRDGFLDRDAIKIVLSMGLMDMYSIRSPIEGKVMNQWLVGRRFAVSDAPRFAQWIQTDENDDLLMAIYTSVLPRHPRCYVQSGERVGQGQRCGFMSFGARLEIYVPAESRIEVKPGQPVRAGESVIAHFIHRS